MCVALGLSLNDSITSRDSNQRRNETRRTFQRPETVNPHFDEEEAEKCPTKLINQAHDEKANIQVLVSFVEVLEYR